MISTPRILFGSISLLVFSSLGYGQSLSIGSADALAGATVEVPVNVSVSEDLVGLHLRLKYNSDVFSSPQVEKGPLLGQGHLLEYFSPAEGELNIVAYSKQGGPPFDSHEGTILKIQMTLSDSAVPGSHTIGFATPVVLDSIVLSPTGLSGAGGDPIAHTTSEGSIRVEGLSGGDLDGNEVLDGKDLFTFSSWWRLQPDSSNSQANVIQSTPNDLVEARDLLTLINLWKDLTELSN